MDVTDTPPSRPAERTDRLTMPEALFSAAYWAFLAVSAAILYLGAVLVWLCSWADPDRRALHAYTGWWSVLYLRVLPGCRRVVEGREKIRPRTPYVIVANHQSMTDIMALAGLGVMFKWVSKKEVFRMPFIGWNMTLNRYVSVDRGNIRSVRATMDECRDWLERKVPLIMFPEGHRSPDGEVKPFHTGSFKLALEARCAVVPVVVDGTWPIYRGFKVLAFPGTVTVRVLDPVAPEEAGGSADRLKQIIYDKIVTELAAIRARTSGAAG